MTTVTYRPYRESDAGQVKPMLNEAFHIHRYTGGSGGVLDSALEFYLREVLIKSTWSQVAVIDGRVVGIITGRLKGQAWLPNRRRNRLRLGMHAAKIAVTGWGRLSGLRQQFGFSTAYAQLHRTASQSVGDLGAELTVFVVDSSTRGTGVGKSLYRAFREQVRQTGGDNFYLYTDTLCSYGFYEKQGMVRAAQEPLTLHLPGLPEQIGVYLYTGRAREHEAQLIGGDLP